MKARQETKERHKKQKDVKPKDVKTMSERIFKVNGFVCEEVEGKSVRACFRCAFFRKLQGKPYRREKGWCAVKKEYVKRFGPTCSFYVEAPSYEGVPVYCSKCGLLICWVPFFSWKKHLGRVLGGKCPRCGHVFRDVRWVIGGVEGEK